MYAAMTLTARAPRPRVILVERGPVLGGRARLARFHNAEVVTGAGVGRKSKDVRLAALAQSLGVPLSEFPVRHTHSRPCGPSVAAFEALQAAYERLGSPLPHWVTFRTFATAVLGPAAYQDLVRCAGYTDFESAAVADVLFAYGFDDNLSDWTGLRVPWAVLIDAMAARVAPWCRVLLNCSALRLARAAKAPGAGEPHRFVLETSLGPLLAGAVVVATEIAAVQALLPRVPSYRHVHGQPFLRLYAAVSGASAAALSQAVRGVTVVPGPLQKLIPVSDGVFMVAYADNAAAAAVHRVVQLPDATTVVARMVERALRLVPGSLRIDDLQEFYFAQGTHYNDPGLTGTQRRRLAQPVPGVFVVGEAVSRHQGWVEGVLESVDDALARWRMQ